MKVDLFYLSPNPYGGWVTYTAHLMRCLEANGIKPTLFKIRPRTEKKERDFGYGISYRNISLDDALARNERRLIVAAAKNFASETEALYNKGAGLVVHDPTELKNLPPLKGNVIVIRRVGLTYIPQATFIRHPYTIKPYDHRGLKKWNAISTCRIDFDKHTDILLDANRLLPKEKRIEIRGFENRIYTRFKIVPNYPEWEQSKAAYPRTVDAAYELLQQAFFAVDMSQIKGDGGGTQYSFLEAMNAGAINVIHKSWVMEGDDMRPNENCLAVADAAELAKVLGSGLHEHVGQDMRRIVDNGLRHLLNHCHEKVGPQYRTFLEGL